MLKRAEVICCINRHQVQVIFLDYSLKGGGFKTIIHRYFLELWTNPSYSTVSRNSALRSPAHQGKLSLTEKKQSKKQTSPQHNPCRVALHTFVFNGKQFCIKIVILTKRTVKCYFSLVSHEVVLNMCRYFKYHVNVTPLAQLPLYIWT